MNDQVLSGLQAVFFSFPQLNDVRFAAHPSTGVAHLADTDPTDARITRALGQVLRDAVDADRSIFDFLWFLGRPHAHGVTLFRDDLDNWQPWTPSQPTLTGMIAELEERHPGFEADLVADLVADREGIRCVHRPERFQLAHDLFRVVHSPAGSPLRDIVAAYGMVAVSRRGVLDPLSC